MIIIVGSWLINLINYYVNKQYKLSIKFFEVWLLNGKSFSLIRACDKLSINIANSSYVVYCFADELKHVAMDKIYIFRDRQ